MANCRSKFVSDTYFNFLKHVVVPEWQDLYRSIIKFPSYTLLTEDLIAIKYTRYLVLHIFTSSIDFSDIKHNMERALLSLICVLRLQINIIGLINKCINDPKMLVKY